MTKGRANRGRAILTTFVVGLGIAASWSGTAEAAFGVVPGSFTAQVLREDATTNETQAGAHPAFVTQAFTFNTVPNAFGRPQPDQDVRNIDVDLPAGFIGNPEATPRCSRVVFGYLGVGGVCPPASQVGVAELKLVRNPFFPPVTSLVPVYNVQPRPTDTVDLGILAIQGSAAAHVVVRVRTEGDYGVTGEVHDVATAFPVVATKLTLWGVPANASHDAQRVCSDITDVASPNLCPAGVAREPFLTNAPTCEGPATTALRVSSWQEPSVVQAYSTQAPTGNDGCEKLAFDPTVEVEPDLAQAGAGAGYSVDLTVPQDENPDGLGTPPLKKVVVTLPEGVSISPATADGLGACTDAQIALGSNAEPSCPDAAKIGSVRVDTPLLPEPMTGEVYAGQPLSMDSQSGDMFRLFLVLHGPGLTIKLKGAVLPNPVTGRLQSTFTDIPPLPFEHLHLQLFGGSRAVLANPPTCGPATTKAVLTAYGVSAPQEVTSSFDVTRDGRGAPCPAQPFSPTLRGGMVNPVAGADSVFSLTFARGDQDQTLRDAAISLPPGLLGRIASATLCPEAAAAVAACPADSELGNVTTAAGPGLHPFVLTNGRAFLTGPYHDAPYGLVIAVHAIAGPFDLGNVIVRARIFVDAGTAALRIVSDPLPSILQGVPLLVRSVTVTVDRPGFMFNPTNCDEKRIVGDFTSNQDAVARASTRFRVGECAQLAYKPRMTLTVGAKGHTHARATVPLTVRLRQTKGEANNRVVAVTLPDVLNAKLPVLENACTLTEFRADRCSSKARVGSVTAVTPVLPDRLKGNVYIVKDPKHGLPDLMLALRGPVAVNLTGIVKIPGGRVIQTRFNSVPDVPITSFTLKIVDDKQGPLGAVSNLCTRSARRAKATLSFRGQNDKTQNIQESLRIRGCPLKPR